MAIITHAQLTEGQESADQDSYTTASTSPSGDQLILAAIAARASASINTPTLSGNGLVWVLVDGGEYDSVGFRGVWLFRAMDDAPSAGVLTIDFGGQTQLHCSWAISEFDNVDTAGESGSAAIVQADKNFPGTNETSLVVTLAAFGDENNATFGAMSHVGGAGNLVTEGTGFAEIAEQQVSTSTVLQTEWRNDNDTTVDWSWGASAVPGGIGVELKASTGVIVVQTTRRPNPLLRM